MLPPGIKGLISIAINIVPHRTGNVCLQMSEVVSVFPHALRHQIWEKRIMALIMLIVLLRNYFEISPCIIKHYLTYFLSCSSNSENKTPV